MFLLKCCVLLTLVSKIFGSGYVEIIPKDGLYSANTQGPQLDGRIVGGSNANITDHPYQVSFQSWHSHSCGGSLITPFWVLTAAHCVNAGPHRYTFRLGSSIWSEGGTLTIATKLVRHPNYNSATIDYDVAVVRLADYQSESDTIQYAQLPPEGWTPQPGDTAVVTGWGTPYYGGSIMSDLQEVKVPIVSNESCQQYYSEELNETDMSITDRMLCAGYLDGSADVCNGDSGGPLVVDGYLVGIVSWSKSGGCATPGYPAVYASVPNLLAWIKAETGLV